MRNGKSIKDRYLWIAGIVGLLIFLVMTWFDPTVRQTYAVDHAGAQAKAVAFWKQQGVDLHAYESTVVMDSDQLADGYLGKYGLQEKFDLEGLRAEPIVYWTVTYYKQQSHDKYVTRIDPDTGQIVTWQRGGQAVEHDSDEAGALQKAQQALQTQGVEQGAPTLKTRTVDDHFIHTYTFEYQIPSSEFALGDMQLLYHVEVKGDTVSEVSYSYLTPTEFQTWHSTQEKIGMVLTGLSLLLTFVLFVLAFIFLFLVKQKKPWWSSLWLGLVVTGLFALSNLNEWPTLQQKFFEAGSSGVSLSIGLVVVILIVAILSVLMGGASYVMILTGGALVKEVDLTLWTPWRHPEWGTRLRRAMWRGFALCFIWLTLQNLFYWVAQHVFGVWFENDFSMSPSNMWFPLLMPLMAWLAGVQEETTYRLFGVTFFKKYWKSSFLACLLPAMIWALGHSMYPIYPVYTRFIELTLFGLLIGYCYLWWGFETVLFAHVAFDAVQMAMPFLFGGNGKELAVGILYLLLPIGVGYGLSLVKSTNAREGIKIPPL
ncbi:CPBP family intramembrane metalloprotease [Tumebacillus sp. ITR2]|uniref:CPBP family intramembrane metalloprotease n=1 Tax=Tumebacillus amylolyticus TaxID=2801339 RepID=A0ABS1J5B3_9BACL|nr:type II CAAX endopeptidase family protein [Tumebacillus amylolyticus]MBL0385479.1 CPBP family intramembrane metalloprotease [Tumebacillus amylolyticus]